MKNEKILILEKRGMDFWNDCEERKMSDLENFRLFGFIKSDKNLIKNKSDKIYMVEISTHFFKNHGAKDVPQNSILTFFDISAENDKKECYRIFPKGLYSSIKDYTLINQSLKKDVLNYINMFFNTNYQEIKIVENLGA